jgi:hypothetical protein
MYFFDFYIYSYIRIFRDSLSCFLPTISLLASTEGLYLLPLCLYCVYCYDNTIIIIIIYNLLLEISNLFLLFFCKSVWITRGWSGKLFPVAFVIPSVCLYERWKYIRMWPMIWMKESGGKEYGVPFFIYSVKIVVPYIQKIIWKKYLSSSY